MQQEAPNSKVGVVHLSLSHLLIFELLLQLNGYSIVLLLSKIYNKVIIYFINILVDFGKKMIIRRKTYPSVSILEIR